MLSIQDGSCLEDMLADDHWINFANECGASLEPLQPIAPQALRPLEESLQYSSREANQSSEDVNSFAGSIMLSSTNYSASRAIAEQFDWSVFSSTGESMLKPNKPSTPLRTAHPTFSLNLASPSSPICQAALQLPVNNNALRRPAPPPSVSCQPRSTAAQAPPGCTAARSGAKRTWSDSGFSSADLSSMRKWSNCLKSANTVTASHKRQDSHMENERARRKNMSCMFEVLKAMLPGNPERIDKATVVTRTISYINALEQLLKKLGEQRDELEHKLGIARGTRSRTPADITIEECANRVSASKRDCSEDASIQKRAGPAVSASRNCSYQVTVGGTHASLTLYLRNPKSGFLSELLAAMEASRHLVQHAYVRVLEEKTLYIVHTQVANGWREAEEEKIVAMLQKVLEYMQIPLVES